MDMNTEIQNQRICEALVSRSVGECVSMLVTHFLPNPDMLDGSGYTEDDLYELAGSYDYEEAAREAGWVLCEEITAENYCGAGTDSETLLSCAEELAESNFANCDDGEMSCAEDWQELCEEQDIDTDDYLCEALEFWTVDNWFAERLKERGEAVGELFGLTIWGRTTSGQAISMDGVIRGIAEGMEILSGQKHEWKV